MKKQLILLILVLTFMVTTFATAQPPFQASEPLTGQLIIIYPKFDYYPDVPITPHIHLFNSTGFVVTDAECTLHIYNNTGNHVFEGNFALDSNNVDYTINISDPDNIYFKLHDWYSFTVYCNNSYEGGFLSSSFQVTQDGEQSVPQNEGLFYLPIAYMLFIIALLIIYQNMPQEHIFIKMLIIILIPALLVGVTGFSLKLAASYTGASMVLWFYKFSNWFSYIYGFYFIIAIYLSLIKHYKKKKNKA